MKATRIVARLLALWTVLLAIVTLGRVARADLPSLTITIDPNSCPGTSAGPTPGTTPFNVLFKNPTATPGPVTVQNFSLPTNPVVFAATVPAGGQLVWSPTFTGQAFICGGNCCPIPPPLTQLFQVPTVPVNVCFINGPLTVKGPGYPVGTSTQVQVSVQYSEPVPFLSTQATDFYMSAQMNPPPNATVNAPWLWGPALHTMGANEGPNMLSAVGDSGHITIDYGPCGVLNDTFQVTSISPYQLSHSISGNLDLSGFANIQNGAALFRDVTTNFTAGGASGTVLLGLVSTGGVLCTGNLTVQYDAGHSHPVVPLPASYHSRIQFNALDISGNFTGTRSRTQLGGTAAPALGTWQQALLASALVVIGMLAVGTVALRRQRHVA
jgi:hypothetical protein